MRGGRRESPVCAGADADVFTANPVPLVVTALLVKKIP